MMEIELGASVPTEAGSTEITRFNALKHGILSRYTVLPWEDAEEYQALVGALAAEHCPQGPTEEHLVEELAGILWRKRRLRLAEAASHRRGLEDTLAPWRETVKAALVHLDATKQSERVVDAIRATAEETAEDIRDLDEAEAMTCNALEMLGLSRNDAYEAALEALRADTREWWEDIPPGKSAIAEVYPALWSRSFAREDRTGDQHDAYSIAAWLSRADRDGSPAGFLAPNLTAPERSVARVEGWILGVPGLIARKTVSG